MCGYPGGCAEYLNMALKINGSFVRAVKGWTKSSKLRVRISGDAFRAWVMMMISSADDRQDGYVEAYEAGQCGLTGQFEHELVAADLLVKTEEGYQVLQHDSTEWGEWQITRSELQDMRTKAQANGAKGAAKRAQNAAAKEPQQPPSEPTPWPHAEDAFTGCYDDFAGQYRENRAKAREAFMAKIPDQAASDLLYEKILVMNGDLSEKWGGFGFVRFLDEYPTYQSRKPKTAPTGHFKVAIENSDPTKRKTGVQEL